MLGRKKGSHLAGDKRGRGGAGEKGTILPLGPFYMGEKRRVSISLFFEVSQVTGPMDRREKLVVGQKSEKKKVPPRWISLLSSKKGSRTKKKRERKITHSPVRGPTRRDRKGEPEYSL